MITLDEAVELSRTGDIWIFRGTSGADRAIRGLTNAPVNHVGMAVVIDDLPPLMWHAELGKALVDVWTGTHHRGVQLHDMRAAVLQWGRRYHQRGWLRQLSGPVGEEMEGAVLRTIARLDGTPFPSTARLATRWARGRLPRLAPLRDTALETVRDTLRDTGGSVRDAVRAMLRRDPEASGPSGEPEPEPSREPEPEPDGPTLETAYCAEVVAVTYEEMGLLPRDRAPNWYDPGRFWSGRDLRLAEGFSLGGEIAVAPPD
ncbi:MAG: hypothetical protein AB7J32_12785 [Pseudonocardia sp.]